MDQVLPITSASSQVDTLDDLYLLLPGATGTLLECIGEGVALREENDRLKLAFHSTIRGVTAMVNRLSLSPLLNDRADADTFEVPTDQQLLMTAPKESVDHLSDQLRYILTRTLEAERTMGVLINTATTLKAATVAARERAQAVTPQDCPQGMTSLMSAIDKAKEVKATLSKYKKDCSEGDVNNSTLTQSIEDKETANGGPSESVPFVVQTPPNKPEKKTGLSSRSRRIGHLSK